MKCYHLDVVSEYGIGHPSGCDDCGGMEVCEMRTRCAELAAALERLYAIVNKAEGLEFGSFTLWEDAKLTTEFDDALAQARKVLEGTK